MNYKRRDFIRVGTQLAAGLLVLPSACKLMPKKEEKAAGTDSDPKALDQFGIQLYTLRDDMPRDPRGVLKQLSEFGYKQIESYEGAQGIFWGMTPQEFKSYMDTLGMAIVASHADIHKDFERKANEAASVGMKYLICPWIGPQKTLDDYKKQADIFNDRGRICKDAGLRFAYHNHDYSFIKMDGQYPQDVLMNNTDPSLVDYEMDIYWVVTAGEDPVTWFKKYPNRFRLSHIKDRTKDVSATEKNASIVLGKGSINWQNVLDEAEKQGLQYFIVEQEKYEGTTPLEAAKANAEYLKQLKF